MVGLKQRTRRRRGIQPTVIFNSSPLLNIHLVVHLIAGFDCLFVLVAESTNSAKKMRLKVERKRVNAPCEISDFMVPRELIRERVAPPQEKQ